jgi:alkylhydroperoxidase family enzyme
MARINYADIDKEDDLTNRIIQQRGKVLHLYRMLLHSPVLTNGWLNFLTAIRQQSELNGLLRELAIVRIAILNRAQYEAEQHRPYALKEGATEAQLDALANWEKSDSFTGEQKAVLAYVDAMTRSVDVPDDIFNQVRPLFSDKVLTELTVTIAAYNMVSRFLVAMKIEGSDALDGG